jgi:transposase
MPRAIAAPVRQTIAALLLQGKKPDEVAALLNVCARSVRRLRHRLRNNDTALLTAYAAGGRRRNAAVERLRQLCGELRKQHPRWGCERIRVQLRRQQPAGSVPCARTLRRWLRQLGLTPLPGVVKKPKDPGRATQPHHTWQVDAKEGIRLGNGRLVCWLRIVDEYTGAVLMTVVFNFGCWADVSPEQVQEVLRRAFRRWGQPLRLRSDNGYPWGTTGGLPSCLGLWLAGLGVELFNNPPRRPQKNGVVEQSQGTGARWSEPEQCRDAQQLQERVDEEDRVQREEYPGPGGQPRWLEFRELRNSGRVYSLALEKALWDLSAALCYLEKWEVRRSVDKKGQVSVCDRSYYVGKHLSGQRLRVALGAATLQWVLRTEAGEEVARVAARGLSQQDILAYNVNRPRRRRTPAD